MLKLLLFVCWSLSSGLADAVQCSSSTGGTFRFSVSSRRNETGDWMVLMDSDRAATPGRPTTLTMDVEQKTRSCEDGEQIHLVTVATVEQSIVNRPGTDVRVETVPTSPDPNRFAASACREYSKVVDSKQSFIDRGTALNRSKAGPREFPHMAMIGYPWKESMLWLCDGVLISPRFVLTMATCVDSTGSGVLPWVRIGDIASNETTNPVRPQEVAIAETILHPDYNSTVVYNDIALLRLEKDVDLNEFVRPACLHTDGDVEGRTGIVTGWGRRWFFSPYPSENLMRAEQHIQPMDKCASGINQTYIINGTGLSRGFTSESMVCVGGEKPTCVTRRGSPIQLIRDDTDCMYNIVGLASFGWPCDSSNLFEVHTRVSYYASWIKKVVWGTGSA